MNDDVNILNKRKDNFLRGFHLYEHVRNQICLLNQNFVNHNSNIKLLSKSDLNLLFRFLNLLQYLRDYFNNEFSTLKVTTYFAQFTINQLLKYVTLAKVISSLFV